MISSARQLEFIVTVSRTAAIAAGLTLNLGMNFTETAVNMGRRRARANREIVAGEPFKKQNVLPCVTGVLSPQCFHSLATVSPRLFSNRRNHEAKQIFSFHAATLHYVSSSSACISRVQYD